MGRNIIVAAATLKDASPEDIQMYAKHDWDMIREVAAVAFAYTPRTDRPEIALPETPREVDARDTLKARISELEKLVYVPGLLKCKKCGFALIKTNLYVQDGTFGANNEPDYCPNDGSPMWRVTERDAANEYIDRTEKMVLELNELRNSSPPQRPKMTEAEALEIRKAERVRIAGHMETIANYILRNKKSDAIDGYNAAVILDLAETLKNFDDAACQHQSSAGGE